MESESRKESGLNEKWESFFTLQLKRVLNPDELTPEEYRDALIPLIMEILQHKGIDIKNFNYKKIDSYQEIKNEQIQGLPGGFMSFEEFIERFLIDRNNESYYDCLYDIGNPVEFYTASFYDDKAVAAEIAYLYPPDPSATESKINDYTYEIMDVFHRKGGLIERLKKHLGFDLDSFDKDNTRNRRERCKILYFFYLLEHQVFPRENVLGLLSKPSMENIDNTSLNWETHNGEKVNFVKETLGKELPLQEKDKVYSSLKEISFTWDNVLKKAQILLEFLYDYGFDYNSTKLIQSSIPLFANDGNNPEAVCDSPIGRLYLIILQKEYLGNLLDIAFINKIQNSVSYDVPTELVAEMKSLSHSPVDFNEIEKYVSENALRLSRYVYLGKKTTKEDVRRIRTYARKIPKFLKFCYRANCRLDTKEIANELQIVSILQALILDNQSEEFNYTYYGYQKKAKHMKRVQAALKDNNNVPNALQIYWVRKVTDHWYANVGKHDVRLKLRQIEETCDEIRKQILSQPTLEKTIAAHNFYLERIDPGFFDAENQIQSVIRIMEFLQGKGFKYEDYKCKIRYAFLDSENSYGICNCILKNISDTVQDHDSFCEIRCDAKGAEWKDAGFFLKLTFDYLKNTCTLTQFNLIR